MIDAVTAILIILILIAFLGHCVLDWIELRDEWWDMMDQDQEDEEDGSDN